MRPSMIASCLLVMSSALEAATMPSPQPSAVPGPKYALDSKLEGPESAYTGLLLKFLKAWPPQDMDYGIAPDGNPVKIRCIETPGSRFYIGLDQHMIVDAPLGRVSAVLDDMEHYKELFPDLDDVHVVSRDGNRIVTFWEQHIPVFFIPNVKYEMVYLVDSVNPDRRVYRYQLKKSGHIKTSDGVIVLESQGPSRTRYTEYDFYDADWGALKTISPGRIWKDSVEGIYLSDVAIKLKSENPDWSYQKIREESRKVLERFPVDDVLKKRRGIEP